MKLLINTNIFKWKLTGLLGHNAKWFLGFSSIPNSDNIPQYTFDVDEDIEPTKFNEMELTEFSIFYNDNGTVGGIVNDYSNFDTLLKLNGNFESEKQKEELCELIIEKLAK